MRLTRGTSLLRLNYRPPDGCTQVTHGRVVLSGSSPMFMVFKFRMNKILAAIFCLLSYTVVAQEGHFGHDHEKWHESFYRWLKRSDGFLCCNLRDCRPTTVRTVDDHYEVKVDSEWIAVPDQVILHIAAPDGGEHVCAPKHAAKTKTLYCVILPSEG